jgi:DNA-binding transcriptional MerR regulator
MSDELTPAEMADACDVTIDTLRYYEREGLLDQIPRTDGGQRRFSPDDVAWVRVLRCLRTTAMPIREMRRFAELVRIGDSAIPERIEVLARHRAVVLDQMVELNRALEMIDHKLEAYSTMTTAQGTPLVSDAALPDRTTQEA